MDDSTRYRMLKLLHHRPELTQREMEALNEQGKSLKGARVLLLGAAYKKNVDDDLAFIAQHAQLVVDTRNLIPETPATAGRLFKA